MEELILEVFILVLMMERMMLMMKNSWKEFDVLENTDQKYYCSDYYDVSVNKLVLNVVHH